MAGRKVIREQFWCPVCSTPMKLNRVHYASRCPHGCYEIHSTGEGIVETVGKKSFESNVYEYGSEQERVERVDREITKARKRYARKLFLKWLWQKIKFWGES